MKISYVIIVLNGMPFLEFCLKAVYAFAHEIIIVEGAVTKCRFAANSDGSSNDGTVEFIKTFPDPSNKVKFVQGIWPEKCEMQNEALKHVSGDYIWLVDSDEIYLKKDTKKIIQMLEKDLSITQVDFFCRTFWKGFDYYIHLPAFDTIEWSIRRVFKYVPGVTFKTHRPPTLIYPKGVVEKRITALKTSAMGIRYRHYSYILESQVKQKIELYRKYGWGKNWKIDLFKWYTECFLKWTPKNRKEIEACYGVWTGSTKSYTELFEEAHPEVILNYIEEFKKRDKT